MARITLVVPVFPKVSETFIVNKFLGLLATGHDVSIVAQRLDFAIWTHYPALAALPGLRNRLLAIESEWSVSNLVRLAYRTLRVLVQRPHTLMRYLFRRWQSLGPRALRHYWGDLAVISTSPDIVHFEFGSLAVAKAQLGRLLNCKIVVSFRGFDLNYAGLDSPGYYDGVWKHADAVHCLGEDLWKRAIDRGCPPRKEHALIPPSIDSGLFAPSQARDLDKIGSTERPLRLLSVGRLEWKKGYEYALAAVRELLDQGLTVEYRIIGSGGFLEAIMFCRSQLRLGDSVRMLGSLGQAEIRQHMQWADVFLHAAVSEGFCNAVVEAQSMELPVVTSDADGLRENVEDGVTGFVVARRDWRALAERVRKLADDGQLRAEMGRAGRRRVCANFRLPQQIKAFDGLYRRVLETDSPASGKVK